MFTPIRINSQGLMLNGQSSGDPGVLDIITINLNTVTSDFEMPNGQIISTEYKMVNPPICKISSEEEKMKYLESINRTQDYEMYFQKGANVYIAAIYVLSHLKIGPPVNIMNDVYKLNNMMYYDLLFQSLHPTMTHIVEDTKALKQMVQIASNFLSHYMSLCILNEQDENRLIEHNKKYYLLYALDLRWQAWCLSCDDLSSIKNTLCDT